MMIIDNDNYNDNYDDDDDNNDDNNDDNDDGDGDDGDDGDDNDDNNDDYDDDKDDDDYQFGDDDDNDYDDDEDDIDLFIYNCLSVWQEKDDGDDFPWTFSVVLSIDPQCQKTWFVKLCRFSFESEMNIMTMVFTSKVTITSSQSSENHWLTHWLTGVGARRCYRI